MSHSSSSSSGVEFSALIAICSTALFTGGAMMITIAEQPARMKLESITALKQWAPSYQAAARMQASLVVIATLSGLSSWTNNGSVGILCATLFIFSNLPYTLISIMPINKQLLQQYEAYQQHQRVTIPVSTISQLLQQWGKLHLIRTVLGTAATVTYFVSLI